MNSMAHQVFQRLSYSLDTYTEAAIATLERSLFLISYFCTVAI